MNRREALAALVALPEVARISTAPLKPSDVIVVECDEHISSNEAARIKAHVQQIWPGREVLVLGKSLRLKVVEGAG